MNFKNELAERIFQREIPREIAKGVARTALRKLVMLNAATRLEDLKVPPANHLEKLERDRKGQYSIRINDQYRICFKWHDGNCHDVEVTDYH